MTQATGTQEKITALYGRLSEDDGVDLESNSISNQRTILQDYARCHGFLNPQFFYDDGVSGTTFDRPGFRSMETLIEAGQVSTVIVKDLSRFGRNYLEVGHYLEVVYPSLGVKFIAIQENVDTQTGTGTEMMPFHNIFNEWYAAQTSKKIRAVWAMKASNGKRVGSSVPYGYVKDKSDHEIWRIDPYAAGIVRKIYDLCLNGKGPLSIARQLQTEKVLIPSAYAASQGRRIRNTIPENPYFWDHKTVSAILANRQYTGCTVNFKSTTVSYKVHKTVHRDEKDWQIIPNTQEAIIDEPTWLRVQELRKTKRRPTKAGHTSLFSGLVYCPDCGARMHFCAAKCLSRDQEYFRCSNYKSGRGPCTAHHIRDVVLKRIVLEAVSGLSEFARRYEPVFLSMLTQKNELLHRQAAQSARTELEHSRRRSAEIDRIIARLYEDNISGKLSDERFARMSAAYEAEQRDLEQAVSDCEAKLREAEQATVDLQSLLRGLREFTEVRELTPAIVNTLIQRIEVHNSEKRDGRNRVKVDIYFTAAGLIDLPTEQEIERIRKETQTGLTGGQAV